MVFGERAGNLHFMLSIPCTLVVYRDGVPGTVPESYTGTVTEYLREKYGCVKGKGYNEDSTYR